MAMVYEELDDEQIRQLINAEQLFGAYRAARDAVKRRYAGSMAWKTVEGRDYLYRGQSGLWRSVGPRGPDTEAALDSFSTGRERARERHGLLGKRLERMAAFNRAHKLGRVPRIAGRILRALADARLSEPIIVTVGTNALFAYERMAGVRIAEAALETADIDFLYDARTSLKLLAPEHAAKGVLGVLRKVDPSFDIMGRSSFRTANNDGYIVDLITPTLADPMRPRAPLRIGSDSVDLVAAEIEGLAWLVNSPKVTATIIDTRGYPAEMTVPDPRAFALHKAWLSTRPERDPIKRSRDRAQAELVAGLVATRLPHLTFGGAAVSALPAALRAQADFLALPDAPTEGHSNSMEPDW